MKLFMMDYELALSCGRGKPTERTACSASAGDRKESYAFAIDGIFIRRRQGTSRSRTLPHCMLLIPRHNFASLREPPEHAKVESKYITMSACLQKQKNQFIIIVIP